MNKYPLDTQAIDNIARDLSLHDKAQSDIIGKLVNFLRQSMCYIEDGRELEWYVNAETLLKTLHTRNVDFQNLRFDQQNGHKVEEVSPYSGSIDVVQEAKLNQVEEGFGSPMTEEELAIHFGEPLPKKKVEKSIAKMTLEEIKSWEKAQDNSNDIYKISARVKNLAREGGAGLTPVGESLCNTYIHVMKAFYDFADNLEDKEIKIKLTELIRKQEGMPSSFIAATHANVKTKSDK